MNNRVSLANSPQKSRIKGFALVLALSLLSLVFLLVVSLVSLVGTDLSLSEARKDKILSQVHARMGMKIAIGEIQKHLGPDMRISATADLLDERVESGRKFVSNAYNNSATGKDEIDLNEDGSTDTLPFGQRYWTGVWKHRARAIGAADSSQSRKGTKPLPENYETGDAVNTSVTADTSYDPHPAIEVAWLVSGNEGHSKNLFLGSNKQIFNEYVEIPDGNIYDTAQLDNGRGLFKGGVYGKVKNAWQDYQEAISSDQMSDYDHPLIALEESLDTTWILKAPLLSDDYIYDSANPESWRNNLKGEPIKVRKTEISEIRDSANTDTINKVGAYAYWVGDEGVKTKVNLDFDFLDELVTSKELLKRDRITVAMEPNIGTSTNSENAGFDLDLDLLGEYTLLPEEFKSPLHRVASPNFLAELIKEKGDSLAINKVAAHFHSVTTDSFGVLTDVRTGGLKRDLSSAFAMDLDFDDKEWDLENENEIWASDFKGYLYKDRIHCLKSLPMDEDAKENEWFQSKDDATMDDKNAILAGPRWTVLGSYHNLYQSSSLDDLLANDFPRIVGDNSLVFNSSAGSFPDSPNPFWGNDVDMLLSRYNWFAEITTRPEPKNHPIQPILTEVKYSHVPVWDNGIGLAAYPSVALWNPYNQKINLKELFLELPLRVKMRIMNPLEYDSYRKWFTYNYNATLNTDANSGEQPVRIPDGMRNFEDLNGNGRRDPGEPYFWPGGDTPSSQPRNAWRTLRDGFDYIHTYCRSDGIPNFEHRIRPDGLRTWGRYEREFLVSSDVLNNNNQLIAQKNRHLLLHIDGISLDPGEKAHFVVSGPQYIEYTTPPENGDDTEFVKVTLSKGRDLDPFIFRSSVPQSGNGAIYPSDPVSLRFDLYGIQGIHPRAKETFDRWEAERTDGNYVKAKGITLYSVDPTGVRSDDRKVVFKLNKGFSISLGGQHCDFLNAQDLPKVSELTDGDRLMGNGFRIRLKFPGLADSVVTEQYNLRAFIHSYQDGYGDNWEQEEFVQTSFSNSEQTFKYFNRPASDIPTISSSLEFDQNEDDDTTWTDVPDYFDFYKIPKKFDADMNYFDFNETYELFNFRSVGKSALNPSAFPMCDYSPGHFDAFLPMPRSPSQDQISVGYFHDGEQAHGSMSTEEKAVLFDVPQDPMLSIFQFRHANLNNYVHGPSYSMGNSYASPQVARYKTWGRVRAITIQPKSELMNIQANVDAARELSALGSPNYFSWKNRTIEYTSIRDQIAQNEHQNTTTDHSYYLNRSLVDGYFFTGVSNSGLPNSENWNEREETLFEPGYYYLPYRNPRLLPYYRDNEWKQTSYDALSSEIDSVQNENFLHQTKAADLLVNGAFNINSTSVDAWFSQLSSLRGQPVPSSSNGSISVSNETPFPRYTDHPEENSWNVLSSLTDDDLSKLAFEMVKQVKLRGPFLSFADFTNRRVQGNKANRLLEHFSAWDNDPDKRESRSSVLGLRGTVQAAIAKAGLNDAGRMSPSENSFLVEIPEKRYDYTTWDSSLIETPFRLAGNMGYVSSKFGIPAFSKFTEVDGVSYLHPAFKNHRWKDVYYAPNYSPYPDPESIVLEEQKWGRGTYEVNFSNPPAGEGGIITKDGGNFVFKYGWDNYEDAFSFGEAPENLLAVENAATAANKPGWLMQSDVLSPLAPVTSARSDTFLVRVMGEHAENNQSNSSKSWIELTVQRIPDYVKPDLDGPHHRPHEPFEDRNFNGYWDSGSGAEHWLDLNQNSWDLDGDHLSDSNPDLPGSPKTGKDWYADGLASDLPLEVDSEEEDSSAPYSRLGINQRFGRKFKIIKFRWLREQDV